MPYDQASYIQETPLALKALLSGGSYTTQKVTILSGQNLAMGAVLGKITASGKHILSLSAAVDGSQAVDLVLAHATDASAGDKEAIAIKTTTHDLNAAALVLGTAHTLASIREAMRDKGLPISA